LKKVEKEEKRRKDEDLFKVVDSTIDTRTYLNIIKISRRLNLNKILGAISSGKEAKVYPAVTYDGSWVALKIYYVSTAQSKRAIEKYMFSDPRFEGAKATNSRKLLTLWAKKEYGNLDRMYNNGVRVPRPIAVLDNILAMEFIGEEGARAPMLYELPEDEITADLYADVMSQIERMVSRAKLIHGDLSEYNVMVYQGKCYIIDVGQAVPITHENAEELLMRDLKNVSKFFESHGIEVRDPERVFYELWEEVKPGT
jgi:Serine/threonine protein kinase involved in cell cycle control